MAVAVARGRLVLAGLAWGSGALVLGGTALLDPRGSLTVVLVGILVAAAMPLLVLTVGTVGPTVTRTVRTPR